MSKIPFYMSLLTERTGVRVGSFASPLELTAMGRLGMPPALLKFYEQMNPAGTIEIGKVQLHSLVEMEEQNTEAIPGMYLAKAGYIVFASTVHGDLYCFDTTMSKGKDIAYIGVQLFSHESETEFEGMNSVQMSEFGVSVANNLEEFLAKMLRGTLQTDPDAIDDE